MSIFNVISLFGGLALFLYGMRIMGDGLQRGSSGALKKAMEKVTNNPFSSFLLGLCVTGIIQSSTATIVLTSGLVGAGIISLHQSLGIILGANVGTTVTGQIIRLLDLNTGATAWLEFFKPSTLAPLAAIIGIILIMAFKFRNAELIGNTAMGFGILFTGLLNMTAAVSTLSESPSFSQIFITLADKPLLGFFAGAGVAFIIQSSSATVGILQALALTGKLSFSSVYSVIIGIYMGDCVTTAIVCSIGAKADAKRTGMVHILFNLCEVVLVTAFVTLFHKIGLLDNIWSRPITSGGIANTHTFFKLSTALIMLPVVGYLEKLSMKIVKDDVKKPKKGEMDLESLDKAFLEAPALAFDAVQRAVNGMANIACGNARKALNNLLEVNEEAVNAIHRDENEIDRIADQASNYLVRLSPHVEESDNEKLNFYIKCISEFERIGDYAENLTENAADLRSHDCDFSPAARQELSLTFEALNRILDYTCTAFFDHSPEAARRIEPLEEVIDELVAALRAHHVIRLRQGQCNVYAGFAFLDALTNIERISDQCSNVGTHTLAMLDPSIAAAEHDYIRRLHEGEVEEYSREYRALYDDFFTRLMDIEQNSRIAKAQ